MIDRIKLQNFVHSLCFWSRQYGRAKVEKGFQLGKTDGCYRCPEDTFVNKTFLQKMFETEIYSVASDESSC